MRDELIQILRRDALGGYARDADGDFVPLDWSGTPDSFFEDTVTSIINLVDKEVIGSDQEASVNGYFDPNNQDSMIKAGRNSLRAEQRAIIRSKEWVEINEDEIFNPKFSVNDTNKGDE